MTKANQKKFELLGINHGTAHNRLYKMVLLKLIRKLGEDTCYRCQGKIVNYLDLSLEHTEGWQLAEKPIEAFFNLEKIAFSHLKCNIRAKRTRQVYDRKGHKFLEGSFYLMKDGKRICKECNKLKVRKYRLKLRSRDVTAAMPVLETGARNSV